MVRLPALGLLAVLFVAGCATTGVYRADGDAPAPLPSERVAFTVFLAGNTTDFDTDAVLRQIGLEAGAAGENSAVVLLGDLEGDESRAALTTALRGYSGRVVAVPGDRDGRDVVDRLEDALGLEVEGPNSADGELREVDLTETLRLVALDTPWWLSGAETADAWHPADAATELERLVIDRDDEQLIIVGHHPLESNGRFGGARTFFGGIATLGVAPLLSPTVGVTDQDLASPTYRRFTQALASAFGNHERLVYAGASDHSLQAFTRPVNGGRGEQTLLVSGTGGGDIGAAQGGYGAAFVAPKPGFWRLTYYADGSLWSEAVALEGGQPTVLYSRQVAEPDAELSAELAPPPQVTGRVDVPSAPVTQPLDAGFDSGSFRNDGLTRFFAGAGYRDAWKTPVGLPVLDMGAVGGGLTPLRASGGNQTTGLRLQGEDGHVYEVRLIEKGGTGGLPEPLRDGFAGDLVLDLRSAALPYAAVVAADLAASAGLYAPQPQVLFVPDDPRLGVYRETFGGKVALFEVRPDDDMSDLEGWTEVTDVISSGKLREELADDQDHRVDQRAFFRARLLDLMVSDWDRHAGQWRWAAFEPGELDPTLEGDAATKGKVYQPIPRDRDWAFYDLGGVAQRALFQFDRRYQPFGEGYGSILGLTANARGQDRRFMSEITRDDALMIADDLGARLTDAAIDRAIDKIPDEIRAEVGDEWRTGLVNRRNDLGYAAERLYELAAQTVDVVGSDERERFSAVPSGDGGVTVIVESFKGGDPGLELYRRTFRPGETREVRLYGRGGRDQFDVAPDADAIAIRVIGGGGRDNVVSGESDVTLYDTPDGIEVEGPVDDRRSDDPGVNRYSEDERVTPLFVSAPIVGARATDGVILGGSVTKTSYGFRMRPYASQQTFAADVATGTWGVRASYDGHFVEAIGPFDARVGLSGALPRNVRNFYGLGNETAFVDDDVARLN
ncbi:hypothetical protein, partial [Rubrivirga sp.]|uniref:hypothetical protein n=1 Tax=Rubrivirga sp. TaxID=1885344 RepID=UPI003C70B575